MEDDQPQPPESLLPYATWIEEAQRQVVVRAVTHVATHGMPGAHHFYLTFRTDLPGVTIPPRLRAQYPNEITIVLQHQYWDLAPGETFFSVTLQFGGQPKRLSVPYAAVTRFYDPSVQFLLQFEAPAVEGAVLTEVDTKPALAAVADPATPVPDGEAKIVSLDQFRKK